MLVNNNMNLPNGHYVQPVKIVSPSGQLSTPKIIERVIGDNIHVEAHWFDPANGTFIRKGIVEIRSKKQ